MRCAQALDTGSYVLGALSPAERQSYERHLAGCPGCREEVAELAALPGLLGRLDAATAMAIARDGEQSTVKSPEDLLPRTLAAASTRQDAQRRRRRWQAAGALATAACLSVLAGGSVHVWEAARTDPPAASAPMVPMTPMRPVSTDVPLRAEVALVAFKGGTELRMRCSYYAPQAGGARWSLTTVVYPRGGGTPERVGSWTADSGEEYLITETTRFAPDEIGRIEVQWGTLPQLFYEP
jgi:hypothetical protein